MSSQVMVHWVREELELDPQCAPLADEICQKAVNASKVPITRRVVELLRDRASQIASDSATQLHRLPANSPGGWLKDLQTKYAIRWA
jgi:hypothetical protein